MLVKRLELQPLQNIHTTEIGQQIELVIGKNRISCTVLYVEGQDEKDQVNQQLKKLRKIAGRLQGKGYFPKGSVAYQRQVREK